MAKVEANQRTLAADELIALALVLQCPLSDLLLGASDGISVRRDPTARPDPGGRLALRVRGDVPAQMSTSTSGVDLPLQVWTLHGEVDPRLRDWVQQEMERWAEGRRLLRQPVTEAAVRQHRSVLWVKLAFADEQELRDVLDELDEDSTSCQRSRG